MALRTCSDDPSLLIDVRLCDCQVASIPECCGNKTVFTQCAHRYFICFAAGSQSPSASTSPSPTPSASECMPGCHLSRWCHVVSPLLLCYMKEAIVAGIFSFFCKAGDWGGARMRARPTPFISACLLRSHHHHSFPAHPAASPSGSPSAEASPSTSQCMLACFCWLGSAFGMVVCKRTYICIGCWEWREVWHPLGN